MKDCPAFAAVQNNDEPNACQFTGQVVDENIGLSGPLSALPGCNPTWNGDGAGTKPTCATQTTPGFKNSTLPLPSGWTDLGCIAEGTNGRALTGASLKPRSHFREWGLQDLTVLSHARVKDWVKVCPHFHSW